MTRQRGLFEWLNSPQDAGGLAAFRILFGALMVFAVVRFWANGWIHELYIAPSTHFTYLGFDWVKPWAGRGMYAHFAIMGLAALAIMLGAWTRVAAAVFFLGFTYAELIEKSAYLNHYYFVSLIALLLIFVPSEAEWSVDRWRRGEARQALVGRWTYLLLRGQVALVYFFAGLAKLSPDWLLQGEPLRAWLQAYADLPLIGPVMGQAWLAFAMSWGGAFYDLTIFGWLLHPKTRPWAYCASIVFHLVVWLLFPIGVFSWVMLSAATLFFAPSWPRRIVRLCRLRRAGPESAVQSDAAGLRLTHVGATLAAIYLAVQVLVPLRFVLYPGNVNWTEEGFRFAWRVMLIEKTGQVEYEVRTADGQSWRVYPRNELTRLQYRMMSTQPDMIHEYALTIAERFRREGHTGVRVYAHAWAALNGRSSQRLIDPRTDLASEPRSLAPSRWILGLGHREPPEQKHAVRAALPMPD